MAAKVVVKKHFTANEVVALLDNMIHSELAADKPGSVLPEVLVQLRKFVVFKNFEFDELDFDLLPYRAKERYDPNEDLQLSSEVFD